MPMGGGELKYRMAPDLIALGYGRAWPWFVSLMVRQAHHEAAAHVARKALTCTKFRSLTLSLSKGEGMAST
jgi:hypothetical protein